MKAIDKICELAEQREEMFKHEEANWPLVSAIKLMRWTLFMYLIAFIALYFICTWGINALSGFIFMGYFVIGNWLLGYVGVNYSATSYRASETVSAPEGRSGIFFYSCLTG